MPTKVRSRRFDRMISIRRNSSRNSSWDVLKARSGGDDAESCSHSTSSITSSASSIEENAARRQSLIKRVDFYPKVTAYPCPQRELTMADRNQRWLTKADLEAIKDDIRTSSARVFEQREYRAAIERLYDMVRRKHKYVVVDVDDESLTDDETGDDLCAGMTDLDLARLLIDSDTRGLERMLFTRMDQWNGALRPAAKHAKVVLHTQASTQCLSPDARADQIATRCQTHASATWARTLADADAEAVSRRFMLQF